MRAESGVRESAVWVEVLSEAEAEVRGRIRWDGSWRSCSTVEWEEGESAEMGWAVWERMYPAVVSPIKADPPRRVGNGRR